MKKIGHCTQCDGPVFEVLAQFPADHPRAGTPRRLGGLVDDKAVRITYVLADGTNAGITFCGACSDGVDVKSAWRKCLALAAEELRHETLTTQQREIYTRFLAGTARNIPLGELYREKWKDLQDGRIQG